MFDYQSLSPHVGEQEVVVERQFTAPRTLMFQVFTQPEHLKRWWAPQPYTIPVCTIDLRPGGIWHYCMRSPEGQDHWARSVMVEHALGPTVKHPMSSSGPRIGSARPPNSIV